MAHKLKSGGGTLIAPSAQHTVPMMQHTSFSKSLMRWPVGRSAKVAASPPLRLSCPAVGSRPWRHYTAAAVMTGHSRSPHAFWHRHHLSLHLRSAQRAS